MGAGEFCWPFFLVLGKFGCLRGCLVPDVLLGTSFSLSLTELGKWCERPGRGRGRGGGWWLGGRRLERTRVGRRSRLRHRERIGIPRGGRGWGGFRFFGG